MTHRTPSLTHAAGIIRNAFALRNIEIKHTEALEIAAQERGFSSYQAYEAKFMPRQRRGRLSAAQTETDDKPLLVADVDPGSFKFMGHLDGKSNVWVTMGNISLSVGIYSGGASVEMYATGTEDDDPIATLQRTFNEATTHACTCLGTTRQDVNSWSKANLESELSSVPLAEQIEVVRKAAEAIGAGQPVRTITSVRPESFTNPSHRYVYGDWEHLFGVGSSATMTRVLFDRVEHEMLQVDIFQVGTGWYAASIDMADDVEDSFLNGNSADEDPEEHGLSTSDELPSWYKKR